MGAMEYEYLLRRIYQVGRYGKKGADADIYRSLERVNALYNAEVKNVENKQHRLKDKSIEDLQHDYRIECRNVWGYVEAAIRKSIDKYSNILSDKEVKRLEDCIKEPKEITKELIDEKVKIAQDIFVSHEIYPK